MRWLAVNAKETVLLPDVLAEKTTYPAPIFASAAVRVRRMRTHRISMKLMMTMIVMIGKDSLIALNIKDISVMRSMLALNGH